MSVTERDRETAVKLLPEHQHWCHWEGHGDCCGAGIPEDEFCDCGTVGRRQDIAAALADDRARAREPFLRLLALIDDGYFSPEPYERGIRWVAEKLRRAAQDAGS